MLGKNIADLSRQVEKCAVSSRNVLFFLEVEALVFPAAYLYSKGSIFSLKKKLNQKVVNEFGVHWKKYWCNTKFNLRCYVKFYYDFYYLSGGQTKNGALSFL